MNLNGLSNLPTSRLTHNYNLYSVNYQKMNFFDCKVNLTLFKTFKVRLRNLNWKCPFEKYLTV